MFARFQPLRKTLRRLALPITTVFALAACDTIDLPGGGGGPSINPSQPVPVALLIPRGSGSSSDELLAQSLENAARLAMRDLNGVEIDLRVYATAGNAQTASTRAQEAVNDGARIILGPVYSAAANAAGLAVSGRNVNVLSFSNTTTIAGGNVFVLGPTFQNTANRLVSYAGSQGKSRMVVVHAQDTAGQLGLAAIRSAASRSGASIAGTVDYPVSQQGVVAAIPRIKSAVDSSGADALFLTAPSAGALPLLTQLLPEAGVATGMPQYIGLTRWDVPAQTLDLPGVQGGWFAVPDPNRSAAFSSRYSAAYGRAPHPIAGLAFDGIAAIGALVSSGGSRALTRGSLTQGAGFQGASGVFRLRSDGTNERGLAVATVQGGQVQILSPAPRSFGGAGF
ncbi:MAG: penicillin-binding protein activator [Pseudomonadota bacterium]